MPGMRPIELFMQQRQTWLRFASNLDPEQVNVVPDGYRNSLHWNVAHIVITQQLLTYGRSGLELPADAALVEACRKGSVADGWQAPAFADTVAMISSEADRFLADYEAGRFNNYEAYETSAGITLQSIEDAIAFNNWHEGVHIGYCMALKRAL